MTLQAPHPPLVLASASPARRALLEAAGLRIAVRPARVDEARSNRLPSPRAWMPRMPPLLLADAKARRVAAQEPDALVIGCDQLLVCDGRWFDKPADLDDARAQLRALRGRTHTLVTAALCRCGEQRLWHTLARPRLTMRDFSDAFLECYLSLEAGFVTSSVGRLPAGRAGRTPVQQHRRGPRRDPGIAAAGAAGVPAAARGGGDVKQGRPGLCPGPARGREAP